MSTVHKLRLRFQKLDPYGNQVFIVSSDNEDEVESYNVLLKYYLKLQSLGFGTFLPIYVNEYYQFATIRFKKNYTAPRVVKPNNVYEVSFMVKKIERGEPKKSFINCFITKMKLLAKAPQVDLGEDVDFD